MLTQENLVFLQAMLGRNNPALFPTAVSIEVAKAKMIAAGIVLTCQLQEMAEALISKTSDIIRTVPPNRLESLGAAPVGSGRQNARDKGGRVVHLLWKCIPILIKEAEICEENEVRLVDRPLETKPDLTLFGYARLWALTHGATVKAVEAARSWFMCYSTWASLYNAGSVTDERFQGETVVTKRLLAEAVNCWDIRPKVDYVPEKESPDVMGVLRDVLEEVQI